MMLTLNERVRLFELMERLLRVGMSTSEVMSWVSKDFKKHNNAMMQVSRDCSSGVALSAALEKQKLLDKRFIVIIKQGEVSGKLSETFAELRSLSEDIEMEVAKAGRVLISPASYILAALGIFIFFLLHVFPTFGRTLPDEAKNTLFRLSDSAVGVVNDAPILLAFGGALLVAIIVSVLINPNTKTQLIELSFSVPIVRNVTLGFYLTMWSRYAALSLNAGVNVEETFKETRKLVPDAIGDGLMLTLSEVNQKGWAEALDMDSWLESDPRKKWPVDFCTSLKAGGTSGDIGGSIYQCSETLLKFAKRDLIKISNVADLLGKVLVGFIVGLLFIALMSGQLVAIQSGV